MLHYYYTYIVTSTGRLSHTVRVRLGVPGVGAAILVLLVLQFLNLNAISESESA